MHVNCLCGHRFMAPMAPCPDDMEGCLVTHFDADAFICPACGHDGNPIGLVRENRLVFVEQPGIMVYNPDIKRPVIDLE